MALIRSLPALLLATLPALVDGASVTIVNPGFEDGYFGGNLPPQYNGVVPANAFPVGPAPNGWVRYDELGTAFPTGGSVGVLNPGMEADNPMFTNFPAGAPEGNNVALVYYNGDQGGGAFGIFQQSNETLAASTVYTLTVEVGDIASGQSIIEPFAGFGYFDLRGFPGYRVQLLAGDTVIAEDNNTLTPADGLDDGLFTTSTVQYTSGAAPAELGQALGIRLINLNNPDISGVSGLEVDFDDVRLDASAVVPLPMSAWLLASALAVLWFTIKPGVRLAR